MSVTPDGWPSKVLCPACGGTWTYYTPAELKKRAVERSRRQSRRWYADNVERKAEYNREWYAKVRAKELERREHVYTKCAYCGAPVAMGERSPNDRYCCDGCRVSASAMHVRKSRALGMGQHYMRAYAHKKNANHRRRMEKRWQRIRTRLEGFTTSCSPSSKG
jgi:endogenous inhibitor of DNA gyrase (YacG/DUF329 family)